MKIQKISLFETYADLQQELKVLDQDRKELLLKIFTLLIACLGGISLVISIFKSKDIFVLKPVLFFIIAVSTLVGVFVNKVWIRTYKKEFKYRIVEKLFAKILPGSIYDSNGSIPKYDYDLSKLFPQRVDRYTGEDFVSGKVGETEFYFSELKTYYQSQDKNNRKRDHLIFSGLFFVADFHKNFSGFTFVLPDYLGNITGSNILDKMMGKLDSRPGELIVLEDPVFESLFRVYSTDQVEARYILSSSMMSRIVSLQKKMGNRISIAFVASKVFVAIHTRKNMFEPSLFKPVERFELIHEFAEDFKFTCEIVEELNLNTRIWSKS